MADLTAVLGTAAGRRVLWWLLSDTGMYQTSIGADPQVTAFNEGRRSVGLTLTHTLVDANAEGFQRLQAEGLAALREQRAALDTKA